MYKSKLQELCHKCNWALPKYSCLKDGLDHIPQFKASVVVNGFNFDTITICKSSKEAYNEAAKIAFLHFTSETLNQSGGSGEEPNSKNDVKSPKLHSDAVANQRNENLDLPEKFKKKLQIFAERKDLVLPVYRVERDQDPRAPGVKATVNIGEDCFVSQGLYKTSEEAENAAAQVALLSLSTEALQEDPLSYKNLLQELTQEEGFLLPMYTTIISGEPHNQTFISSVEVEGEIFRGAEAKSKKVAELNAAKAAYTAFIERKLFHPGYFKLGSSGEALKLASPVGSVTISDLKVKGSPGCSSNTSPAIKNEARHGENEDENEETEYPNDCASGNDIELAGGRPSSATLDASILSAADSRMKMTVGMSSYLLGDRVKVYTYIPDIALPEGIVVLPIGQDKWVKVSLEFPNKNDM